MRILIFAAGTLNDPQCVKQYRQPGDVIMAADGGAHHCQALSILPDILIGDFDSLDSDEVDQYERQGVQIIRFPMRKDLTDLELALHHARQMGAQEILVFAALGLRWDQTLANLLLLTLPDLQSCQVKLVDGNQEIFLIRSHSTSPFAGSAGDTVSLIPVNGDALGITSQGLEYVLDNDTLQFGAARGVSNVMLGSSASITLRQGLLICVVIHHTV